LKPNIIFVSNAFRINFLSSSLFFNDGFSKTLFSKSSTIVQNVSLKLYEKYQ